MKVFCEDEELVVVVDFLLDGFVGGGKEAAAGFFAVGEDEVADVVVVELKTADFGEADVMGNWCEGGIFCS